MRENKGLVDIDNVLKTKSPKLYRWLPNFITKYLKRVVHQKEINAFIELHADKNAFEFTSAVRDYFDVEIQIDGLEHIPKEGGCIAVSNHPLGGLDAMAIVPEIENVRTDLKYIVNDILLHVTQLSDIFTGVNKVGTSSRESLRKVEELFASDRLIMLFPSGLVSRKINGEIVDLKWQKTFVSRAKKYNHPIIPIHTSGQLSNWFYGLSNLRKWLGVKANIEMLFLADEMFKQRGRSIKYRIGKPIYVNQLDSSMTNDEICSYVRKELYNLAD